VSGQSSVISSQSRLANGSGAKPPTADLILRARGRCRFRITPAGVCSHGL